MHIHFSVLRASKNIFNDKGFLTRNTTDLVNKKLNEKRDNHNILTKLTCDEQTIHKFSVLIKLKKS